MTLADQEMEVTILKINNHLSNVSGKDIEAATQLLNQLLQTLLPKVEAELNLKPSSDTAVYKFVELQNNFRYNIVQNMIRNLEWMYENVDELDIDTLLLFNRLLQGLLLLHSDSRSLFGNPRVMTQVIRFIELDNLELSIAFITTLLHAMLKDLNNFRIFEECKGCSAVIKKLNLSDFQKPSGSAKLTSQQMLNFKIIEFLLFYLNDEDTLNFNDKRTIEEKSELFREDFPDIDNLIESLNDLKNIQIYS